MIFLLEFSLVCFFIIYCIVISLIYYNYYLAKKMIFNNLEPKKECVDIKYFSYLCDRKNKKVFIVREKSITVQAIFFSL